MPARRTGRSTGRRTAPGAGPARSARRPRSVSTRARTSARAAKRGAVTTDDEQVAKTIRMLREHGQAQEVLPRPRGLQRPARRHPGGVPARQAAAPRRLERAAPRGGRVGIPSNCRRRLDVTVPFEPERSRAVYHLYVIRNGEPRRAGGAPEVAGRLHRACTIRCQCTCRSATATGATGPAACR